MNIDELNLLEFGNTVGLVGTIFADKDRAYLCWFPGEHTPARMLGEVEMDDEDWRHLLRQVDLVETEIIQKGKDGKLVKSIVRKTQRLIEGRVSWEVFKRDAYHCRYCGIDGVPLTVDHLVLWEEGGPSIPENLVTACRKCNKVRGNMPYDEWLQSDHYQRLANGVGGRRPGISMMTKEDNVLLARTLRNIPRRYSERKTRK